MACLYSDDPSLDIVSGWIFHPATDVKPLKWVGDLFDYRVLIKDTNKAGYQVIKLGINSIYGKTAESVGDRPPLYVSPFYAAAITAGTQRAALEAALTAPDDIIMFATDGVYSTKKLDVFIPEKKTLGTWEYKLVEAGGVFVQAGIYLLRYKPLASMPLTKRRISNVKRVAFRQKKLIEMKKRVSIKPFQKC